MKSKSIFLLLALTSVLVYGQDNIRIDSTVRFQTIAGWGHGGGILGHTNGLFTMLDSSVANPVNYQLLDYLIDDLGLTGSRTWEVGPRTDGTGMDNGDCDSIDWSKFQSGTLPVGEADYLVYFKNRVLAKGYQPSFYSSPGYPTHATDQKPWIMYHPGERAQQIWASALYMKNTYGIDINYDVIYNEPSGAITADLLADDIKALGPRLITHGLDTQSQYAEAVAPLTDWNYITPVQNDSELWTYVGRLSYHNYGTADPYRSYILNFGLSKGISTAQTEMGNPTFDDFYNDLTLGSVSYWEVAYSSSNTLVPDTGLTSFTPSATYFRIRQVMHYVSPGAARISATSNDSLLHVLAFSKNGAITTIIENTSSLVHTVFITGLPARSYGLSQAQYGGSSFQELGIHTIGAGDTIMINVNDNSTVTTLYPYKAINLPPTIMIWKSSPGYLVAPSSTATLSSTANDPELDMLKYQWTMASHPPGANPVLSSANAPTTSVSGLNVAGTYVFNIDVSDGANTSSKKVFLVVYSSNPPPVLGSTGFRIGAPYGLVFGDPVDTTHANIELPTSSVTLQAGIADLANSNFTGRGNWSLIRQPPGANVTISSTIYIFVSLRATVTNMTVPGDYVFQINVTNPGHADLTAVVICSVHPASSAPLITSIVPSSPSLILPVSSTVLTAVTSDPEGDLLRHWWVIKSIPSGAKPVFEHQGLPVTKVSGLTVPGIYIFTLRAFDDLHMTIRDVSLEVNSATGIQNTLTSNNSIVIYPNPVSKELNVQVFGNSDKILKLTIINTLGERVMEKIINQNNSRKINVNLESLSRGNYILELQTETTLIHREMIKN